MARLERIEGHMKSKMSGSVELQKSLKKDISVLQTCECPFRGVIT